MDKIQKGLSALANFFSAPSLAAIRNVLTAFATFIGVLGIAGLTQTSLQHLVDLVMSVGSALALLITAIAAVVAAAMPIFAALSATFKHQKKSVSVQPNTLVVQAATPAATKAIADLIATNPGVQQVIASPNIADNTASPKVVEAANAK